MKVRSEHTAIIPLDFPGAWATIVTSHGTLPCYTLHISSRESLEDLEDKIEQVRLLIMESFRAGSWPGE